MRDREGEGMIQGGRGEELGKEEKRGRREGRAGR